MNKTKYLQTDSRWGGLGYPKKPWYLRNCGCGEVAICNIIIEMAQYANYTPATIQPYCKQYAAPNGDGTYWSGIPAMMKHYGMTEVKEHATMDKLWKELAKGDRVAIYLMGSRRGGSNRVHWTSGGHYVCSVAYKSENGKHLVYVKDSYSNSSLRNGWISYEGNMRNDVVKVWSGKLNSKTPAPAPAPGKLVVDGIGGLKTVNRLQAFLGVPQTDGITIRKDLKHYVPSLTAYDYGKSSPTVKAMQKWLGLSGPDGCWGPNTSKALQKKVGATADGVFGVKSMKALQKYLNSHDKAVYPSKPAPKPAPATTWVDKANAWAKAIAKDNSWHYVVWSKDAKTHECPICHNHPKGKTHGWNCIGESFAYWHHGGGLKNNCSCGVLDNAFMTKLLTMDKAKALKELKKKIGLNDLDLIRNGGKTIPQSKMKAGDLCITYDSKGKATHIYPYIGNGRMIDCGHWKDEAKQIAERAASPCKVIIRYTGK